MRIIRKLTIAMLVCSLVLGTVPGMAAEEKGSLSIYDGLGEEFNGLGAGSVERQEPAGDLIALDDIGISVRASDYVAARQEDDGCVYFYTEADGYIPYVMIERYDVAYDGFYDEYTRQMGQLYKDLVVSQDATEFTLGGGKKFTLIVYNYKISGYDGIDIRIFRELNGATYMFCTKAILSLGMRVPNGYIESIAGSMELLSGGDDDYPLHVDSSRSIEPSLSIPDVSMKNTNGKESPTVGNSDKPVGGIGDSKSNYDGVVNFDTADADYKGTWVSFRDGFKLYLPSHWRELNLTDAQRDSGIVYVALDASTLTVQSAIEVDCVEDTTVHSVEDIKRVLGHAAGVEVGNMLLLNGIPCVTYVTQDESTCGLMFFHPILGEPYVFVITAADYSLHPDLCETMLLSLSLAG